VFVSSVPDAHVLTVLYNVQCPSDLNSNGPRLPLPTGLAQTSNRPWPCSNSRAGALAHRRVPELVNAQVSLPQIM